MCAVCGLTVSVGSGLLVQVLDGALAVVDVARPLRALAWAGGGRAGQKSVVGVGDAGEDGGGREGGARVR